MTKAEMDAYKDKKPVAVYPMGNWGGVEILDILYGADDYVICRYNYGEPEKKLHKLKIKYGVETTYFILEGIKVRLDECMRV